MTGEGKRSALIFFAIIAFTLISFISSSADTTTYQYDDNARKVRIEHGTPSYSISGIVTDNNGSALAGVTVSLTGAASASTTTNSNGIFVFAGLSNGSYMITPTKAGYTFSPANKNVAISGGNVMDQDFSASLAAIYSISGTVTSGGSGLSDVTMTLSGTSSGTTMTNSSGNYAFNDLTNGDYTVTPSKTGYQFTPANIAATITGADLTGQNFTASCAYLTVRLAWNACLLLFTPGGIQCSGERRYYPEPGDNIHRKSFN